MNITQARPHVKKNRSSATIMIKPLGRQRLLAKEPPKSGIMSKCVLIVDDEEDVREITKLGLEMGTDWSILTAASGGEALLIAAEKAPDVILLDMMMPDLDGRATLQSLKADSRTQNIPVILVTAKAQSANASSFSCLDIVAVLAKPFRPLMLAQEIRKILRW